MSTSDQLAERCEMIAKKARLLQFAYACTSQLYHSSAPFGAETHRFRLRRKLAE